VTYSIEEEVDYQKLRIGSDFSDMQAGPINGPAVKI
jgi:hypothetical protein